MNNLIFNFECLDGTYTLTTSFDQTLEYNVETSIEGFNNISGVLDGSKTNEFIELIKNAHIENWDKEYLGEGIEDACKWEVELSLDNKKYGSVGLESFEPYNYGYLIKAISLIEENSDYFLVNI